MIYQGAVSVNKQSLLIERKDHGRLLVKSQKLRVVVGRQPSCATLVKCTVEQDKDTSHLHKHKEVYPPYEVADPQEGPFPIRHPGNYPSAHIQSEEPDTDTELEEYDILRDGPLRYLGYANELGEAFAAWLPPGGVPLSYAVAIAYVLTDTVDKGNKALKEASQDLQKVQNIREKNRKLIALLGGERALDTVVWQLLASVAIPGATIHFIVALAQYVLNLGLGLGDHNEAMDSTRLQYFVSLAQILHTDVDTVLYYVMKSVPTFVGLCAIPFIVHPIDNAVHALLNHTLRPAMRVFICDTEEGKESGLAVCEIDTIENDFPVLKGHGPLGSIGEGLLSRKKSGLAAIQDGTGGGNSDSEDDDQFWGKIVAKTSDKSNTSNGTSNFTSNIQPQQNQQSTQMKYQEHTKTINNGVNMSTPIPTPAPTPNPDPVSISDQGNQSHKSKILPQENYQQTFKFESRDQNQGNGVFNSSDGCGVLCQYRRDRDEGVYHGSIGRAVVRASISVVPIGVILIWSHIHALASDSHFFNF